MLPYRILSVDLDLRSAPKDLTTKFFDCLVLLPGLRTLEVFNTSDFGLPLKRLRRRFTQFPSIRELGIDKTTMELVLRCPNVESVTVRGTFFSTGAPLLGSYGNGLKKLKRIVVDKTVVKQGKLGDILIEGTRLLMIHHRSYAGLSGPPRNLHQGWNFCCKSLCRGPPRLAHILIHISSERR